ncbi:PAS domain S-box-containing protein [Desulfuromusa kysingii]|uniref:histidine kinase n=1 Tax=Desulfuromusa kysingii TaxID=37625 RepID=A0A1H4DSW8_9BACT|nr:ATP-binding protein [Desulfuromusa kysingii]SEA75510.1 PAS domain S-box-containing protein [Desulfuromusa kysingii]
MSLFNLGSIRKNLALLMCLAVLPAIAILFYSGMEQRKSTIEAAKQDVLLITDSMAQVQKDIAISVHETLSVLALTTEIQSFDPPKIEAIIKNILKMNSNYRNILLADLNGNVIASGFTNTGVNIADRKHFRAALSTKDFVAGEYIIARVGGAEPAFPFAYPVLDATGEPKAVLTVTINLELFSRLYKGSYLPPESYIAVTDHTGLRLFYFPDNSTTNPVGSTIKASVWDNALQNPENRIVTSPGSDGVVRISAFEQVALESDKEPYMYVWAGVPENFILAPANAILKRNLLSILLTTTMALFISWGIGRKTFITPIKQLISMTGEIARGNLHTRIEPTERIDEFGQLTDSFHHMAGALALSQEDLQRSEERFRLSFKTSPDAISLSRKSDAVFIEVNDSFIKLLGYSAAEIIGVSAIDLKIWKNQSDREKVFNDFLSKGFVDNYATEFVTKNGVIIYGLISAGIIVMEGEKHILAVTRDITERIKSEEQRRELEIQLRQKFKMEAVGIMAGGMAHNFNNSLAIILGSLEMASRKKGQSAEVEKHLNNARTAVLRSRDLVGQLMTYSHKGPQKKVPLQLHLIVEETVALLRSTIPTTIQLQTNISANSRCFINADASQIQECLFNLSNNSVQAMEEEGKLTLTLKRVDFPQAGVLMGYEYQPGAYLRLSIEDNGCGISAEIRDKIFDPFFTTKDLHEGTGMGLSTVQGAIEQHSGMIDVESVAGEGCTFHLYFPIIEKKLEPATTSPVPPETTLYRGNETILYVDDEEMLVLLAKQILTDMGYQVTPMTDSQEAFKFFTAHAEDIQLLITDQTMPGITGSDLIRRVKQIKPEMKTIICTGYSSKVNEDQARELGADAFLMKPLESSKLLQIVRDVLDEKIDSPTRMG